MEPSLQDIAGLFEIAEDPGPNGSTSSPTEDKLRTRIAHLQAEQETLRASHAEAIARAIEEHEERLREQQEHVSQLQAVMMMAADGIVTIDESGNIESFNETASRIFKYAPHEVIGQNIGMLTPEPHRQRHAQYLSDHLQRNRDERLGFRREVVGRRKDGTTFPLDLAVSEVCLGHRRIFTGIFRDVTERRMLEAQLRQAQKLESIGQLAAGIAHEINTPTQYIGDNARFLQDGFDSLSTLLIRCLGLQETIRSGSSRETALEDLVACIEQADVEYLLEEVPKAIAQTLEGVERVAKIVRSMKEFSHPGGEEKQAVDLNSALESTLTVSRNEWKYVADVVTEFDPDLPLVSCMPADCNQVFLNLIVNAAHAIADKVASGAIARGTITVRTRRQASMVEIQVEDTGTGIPENIQGRIYDPFFTTKEVGRGTGQGLAIAHSIVVEKHGGTITFQSRPGEGTTFFVRLPIGPESLSP